MRVSNHPFYSDMHRKWFWRTNKHVQLQHNASTELFTKQFWDIARNGKIAIDESLKTALHCQKNVCKINHIRNGLQYLQISHRNIKIISGSGVRAILVAKNNDVNAINLSVQNELEKP